VSFFIYKIAFKFSQMSYAAALLIVLLVITLIISTLYVRALNATSASN